MKQIEPRPFLAIVFGIILEGLVCWQIYVGKVYFRGSVFNLGAGAPFLAMEIGIGIYIVIKGFRALKYDCWPPPPLFED